MLNRREFSASVVTLSAGAMSLPAAAQAVPQEGKHYVKLQQFAPTVAAPGKIEVVEFFWYGCPHCFSFEPILNPWVASLPADVSFRRVPAAFRENPFKAHQKIYFALEAMGLVNAVHAKVFAAIHRDGQKLDSLETAADFMAKNGVDKAKFTDAFNSFAVNTKAAQAKQLADAYKIDGVPTLGIHGRFYTGASLAGSNDAMLKVASFLITEARKKA